MPNVDSVVDLLQWRRSRTASADGPWRPAPEPSEDEVFTRLERAVRRLDSVASAALEASGSVDGWVETELLAIMGALAMDLLQDAAVRAEHLAERLSALGGSASARR
jgi:hypothetical protein